jgi:hypothetical protein
MLGALEVKKFVMFLGCCPDGHEDSLADGATNVTVLENPSFGEGSGWIRRCSQLPREDGVAAQADHFQSDDIATRCWA